MTTFVEFNDRKNINHGARYIPFDRIVSNTTVAKMAKIYTTVESTNLYCISSCEVSIN